MAPFHLAIDQQDRIWVSNSGINHVTRSFLLISARQSFAAVAEFASVVQRL